MTIEFIHARWWQALPYIRMNVTMIERGTDPLVDRIRDHPWSLDSMLEYGYMLLQFFTSDPYFVVVEGERVGALWLTHKGPVTYLLSFGLLAGFRQKATGAGRAIVKAIELVEDYVRAHRSYGVVTRVAAQNLASQRMARLFDCQMLGLGLATLTFSHLCLPQADGVEVRPLRRAEAQQAWRRWRLYNVERVASGIGVKVACDFIKAYPWTDPLPKGAYVSLWSDGLEVGLAVVAREEIVLLCIADFWPWERTSALLGALAKGAPITRLVVTREHADALGAAPVEYRREDGRLTMFVLAAWRPSFRARGEVGI